MKIFQLFSTESYSTHWHISGRGTPISSSIDTFLSTGLFIRGCHIQGINLVFLNWYYILFPFFVGSYGLKHVLHNNTHNNTFCFHHTSNLSQLGVEEYENSKGSKGNKHKILKQFCKSPKNLVYLVSVRFFINLLNKFPIFPIFWEGERYK